jgi:DNA (cytosine-5)-methyltransferase 1
MKSLELFSGAGGLALGTAMAGFEHEAVIELDHDSCETLRLNKQRNVRPMTEWEVIEADIRHFDYAPFGDAIGFIAGGVPCQPFSLGGKHRGHEDARDMFPEFIRAVDALQPQAFLVENVKGLLRQNFADYFEYIILRLSHPMIEARKSQTWRDHRAELERVHTAGKPTKLDYNVVFQLLNAADFGVPQRRERVFIVGFRSDLGVRWSFPAPTHSREALLRSMWVDGDYWERHRIPARSRPRPNEQLARSIADLRGKFFWDDDTQPWRTVRDAISGLRSLKPGETDPDDPNHFLNPGARSYKGHTGSPWDEPAKTLKAGDHGVPGGENTLAIGGGETRYFSPRECARIQTFPDEYRITGSWTEQMRQMGNAVPVTLAEAVSRDIHAHLTGR